MRDLEVGSYGQQIDAFNSHSSKGHLPTPFRHPATNARTRQVAFHLEIRCFTVLVDDAGEGRPIIHQLSIFTET